MKKMFLLSLFVALAATGVMAQDEAPKDVLRNGPKIEFVELTHNYGTVAKGGNGNCEFVFNNNGNEPLILSRVQSSCGCTVPSWTKEPIMPGQKGTIKVRYNTSNVGNIDKSITVMSNAVDNPRVVLKIKGTVVDK